MAIELISNVKVITSGVKPTTSTLKLGEMAFGKVDGYYHLYGNSDNSDVIDIVLSTLKANGGNNGSGLVGTLDEVLGAGNTTGLDIIFNDDNGNVVVIGPTGVTIEDKNGNITELTSSGIESFGMK